MVERLEILQWICANRHKLGTIIVWIYVWINRVSMCINPHAQLCEAYMDKL